MEILSSGSFINLENQEKIEQLKSTAVQLANAAMETDGFTNDEGSGKRLALEFWQGLEYMCRESEEATIKNIFLNHFLDRLRNARPTQSAAIDSPQDSEQRDSVPIDNEPKPEDEFLGVIGARSEEEISSEETMAEIEEKLSHPEGFSPSEISSVQETEVKAGEDVLTETVEELTSSTTIEETASSTREIEEKVESSKDVPVKAKRAVGNLSLPEKEPYHFSKCTVTATIQLLPEGSENATTRQAVLSVRTHDFAPQISLVELTAGNNLLTELMPELEKVFAKFKSDLPAKVMEKLKREKTAAKKTAPKTSSETKTVSQATSKSKENVKSETAPPEAVQTDAPAVVSPATQTDQQGSLFGF